MTDRLLDFRVCVSNETGFFLYHKNNGFETSDSSGGSKHSDSIALNVCATLKMNDEPTKISTLPIDEVSCVHLDNSVS